MWMYWIERDGELVLSETKRKSSFAVQDTRTHEIYSLTAWEIIAYDDEKVCIGSKILPKKQLRLLTPHEAQDYFAQVPNVVIKPTKQKLPRASSEFHPLNNAIILCIQKYGKETPLERSKHDRKLNILRKLEEQKGTGHSLTIPIAEELLSYYQCTLSALFKKEFRLE